jgi:myo-inositol-1(or 4)-monophosphatase
VTIAFGKAEYSVVEETLDVFARFAEQLARDAGAILRDRFEQPHEIQYKGPIDVVTEADKASEDLIASRIREAYGNHDLLGEEGARGELASSDFRWVIDPLDGTTNFTHGLPTFAVSIALEQHGLPVVGVVYDPMRDEMFSAHRGAGATLNGLPLKVAANDFLIRSLLVTGFSYDMEIRARQAEIWRDLLTRVQAIRQTGSAALNLCYIAAGRFDGYWERGISPWDVSAGALIVLEAGGAVTDLEGGPFRSDDRQILASNGALHAQLLEIISQHPDPIASTIELGA